MVGVGDDEALTQQPENTSSEEDDTDEEFVEADNGESQPKKKKDKKDKEKDKYPCMRCQKNVSKNGVQCTSCRLWVHMPCQKISKDLYKILTNPKKFPGLAWYCDSCQASSARLDARVRAMETDLAGVEAKVVRVESAVLDNTKRIMELERKQEKMENTREAEKSDVLKEWNEEARERETRKRNIVVHRLPEASADIKEVAERKNCDLDNLDKVLTAINLKFKSRDTVKFCRRVGERTEDGPRPMVVGFFRETYKEDVMENAKLLRESEYSEIAIAPDLTKQQRKEEEDLVKEAERRNLARTEEDKAKNLEWTLVGQRGEKRLIKITNRRGGRGGWTSRRGRGGREGLLPSVPNITENWAPQSNSQRGTGALRGAVTQRGAVTGGVYRTERLPSKRNRDQAMGSEEMEEAPPAKH